MGISITTTLRVIEKPWMFSVCTKKDASHYRTDLDIAQNEHVGGHLHWEGFWSLRLKKKINHF